MIPNINKPADVDALLVGLDNALGIDIGNGVSATLGSGRQMKYAQRWNWIIDYGSQESPGHYSDMINLDGFGFYEICRRSSWDAKGRRYETLDTARGRFERFTKRTAEKVNGILTARVSNWHCYVVGNASCYKPTPWR
jgi:hypothetical protein